MAKKKSRRRRRRNRKFLWLIAGITAAISFGMAVYMLILVKQGSTLTKPDELLLAYMDYSSERNYKEMYQMLDVEASGQISEEDFIKRNSAIYEGIRYGVRVLPSSRSLRQSVWGPNAFSENTTNLVLEGSKRLSMTLMERVMRHIGMTFCWQGKQEQQRSKSLKRILLAQSLDGDCFQYVSNRMHSLEDESDIWWHSNRLTKEEWLEIYGGTE